MANEFLPNPIGFIVTNEGTLDNSVTAKFEKIVTIENKLILNDSHYFVEIDDPETKTVFLPKSEPRKAINFIIRKNFIGELIIQPYGDDTIENKSSITLKAPDQIIKLINNTINMWLIL
jgi:hypothetical protein